MQRTRKQLEEAVRKNDPRLQIIYLALTPTKKATDSRWLEFFDAYLDAYDTYHLHKEKLKGGTSSFWLDLSKPSFEERIWKHERFGNYLYGSFLSAFFAFRDLHDLAANPSKDIFLKPLALSRFIHNCFAALDSFACLTVLVKNRLVTEHGLIKVYFDSGRITDPPYSEGAALLKDVQYDYMKKLRNLLIHRPFWRFRLTKGGNYFLPNDLYEQDSITGKTRNYMKINVRKYAGEFFDKLRNALTAGFRQVDAEYKPRI